MRLKALFGTIVRLSSLRACFVTLTSILDNQYALVLQVLFNRLQATLAEGTLQRSGERVTVDIRKPFCLVYASE